MKTNLKTISTLFLILSTFSVSYAFNNYPTIEVIDVTPGGANHNLVNSINAVTSAINNQTKIIQDMATQRKIDALDQSCVKQVVDEIKLRDQKLRGIEKEIDDYVTKNSNNSDPISMQSVADHLNYLYSMRSTYAQDYINLIINTCSKIPKSNDQVCKDGNGVNSKWTGQKESNGNIICGCETGYIMSKDYKCITSDQSCKNSYGNFSVWSGKYNADNGVECGCISGYIIDSSNKCVLLNNKQKCLGDLVIDGKNQCVSKTQICLNTFGANSFWNGSYTTDGKLSCDCANGYAWNSNSTACISKPQTNGGGGGSIIAPTITKQATPAEDRCSKIDPNSFFYGYFNDDGSPTCGCSKGYTRPNSANDKCVLESEVSKYKITAVKKSVQVAIKEEVADNVNPQVLGASTTKQDLQLNDLAQVEVPRTESKSPIHKALAWIVGLFGYKLEK